MIGLTKRTSGAEAGYSEERPRLAIIITFAAVVLVGMPLGLFNRKIANDGSRSADVSSYTALTAQVNGTVTVVRDILEKGIVSDVALIGMASPTVKLIVPDVSPSNMKEAAGQNGNKLDINLTGIYLSRNPIVGIDGEHYRVGDKVHGHTIMEIRETEVVFRSPLGEKVVEYFYEYLD